MSKAFIVKPNGKAILYARVASHTQAKNGNGISSQLHSCGSHAQTSNLMVMASYEDEGVSGNIKDRPGMVGAIARIKKEGEGTTLIIDDWSRLARDVGVHSDLRHAIRDAGGLIVSVN